MRSDLDLSFDQDERLMVATDGGPVPIDYYLSRWRETDEGLAFCERKRNESTFFRDQLRRATAETLH